MKRAAIFSFNDRGAELASRIAEGLGDWSVECRAPRGDLAAQAAELFPICDALIFVGACGIAVRAIAPLVTAKTSDPAVIVADDRGRYVISLLSGHIGGANQLARRVAAHIGGEAVITTATDVNGRFSVDEWAVRHGLCIPDMAAAKRFSAEILRRDLPLYSDFSISGELPEGVYPGGEGDIGAAISCEYRMPFAVTLPLVPRILHLGLGCKRGTSTQALRSAVAAALKEAGLRPEAVKAIASIDIKRDEDGLHALGIPLRFYSAGELREVAGEFSASEFVQSTVGVDNVCERAAMRSAGEGAALLVPKRSANGVTVAIAREEWRVCFE